MSRVGAKAVSRFGKQMQQLIGFKRKRQQCWFRFAKPLHQKQRTDVRSSSVSQLVKAGWNGAADDGLGFGKVHVTRDAASRAILGRKVGEGGERTCRRRWV